MSDGKKTGAAGSSAADQRKRRLAEELRRNLQLRKAQGRARRAGGADETSGLPAAEEGGKGDVPSDE